MGKAAGPGIEVAPVTPGPRSAIAPVPEPVAYPPWAVPTLTRPSDVGTKASGRNTGSSSQSFREACRLGARIPVAYGRVRVVPPSHYVYTRYVDYQSTRIRIGRYGVVWSEGPIHSIQEWMAYRDGNVVPGAYFDAEETRLGTLSQTAISALSIGTMAGVAHSFVECKPLQAVYPAGIVKGRLLYDPRLGAWGAGEYPNASYCAWSANPALIAADILTNTQYGLAVAPSLINWTSVAAAANYCDDVVDGAARWECNLYIREERSLWEWMETVLLHFGGFWRENLGQWTLDYGKALGTPDLVVTDANVVLGTPPRVTDSAGAGLADVPNRVTVEWTDPTTWTVRTVTAQTAEVDAGAAVREGDPYKLHGLQTEKAAQRAALRILGLAGGTKRIELTLMPSALGIGLGGLLSVTLASLGLTDSLWTVSSLVENENGSISIVGSEYVASAFSGTGSGDTISTGFFDVPPELTSVARATIETEVTATTPTSKTTASYLGFSWRLPTFSWPKSVVVRVWPAGTAATWTTAGYAEFVFDATGDPRWAASPTWKGSIRDKTYDTTTLTFDTLGTQTDSVSSGAGFVAILKLRSIAGKDSATGVTVSEAAHSSSTPTPATVEPVLMDAGFTATDGQIAVWDSAAGGVTFPGALALVAPGASATIGGRLTVGVTVTLTADLAAAATTISVNRNTLASGDRIRLESAPAGVTQVEYMAVTSAPNGTGPYTYSVTRNLDGSGANNWKKGDAIFNTGQTGTGFIDLYSLRGMKAATEVGPTIVGNRRNSATWNDWSPRWALGNLNGLYGYATDTYGFAAGVSTGPWIKVDATNGVRIGHNTTTRIVLGTDGVAQFAGTISANAGSLGGWTIGSSSIYSGGIVLDATYASGLGKIYIGAGHWANTDTAFYVDGQSNFSLGNKFTWDNSSLYISCGNVTIDSNGIRIPGGGVTSANAYGFTNSGVAMGGLYAAGNDLYLALEGGAYPSLQLSRSFGSFYFASGYVQCQSGFTTRSSAASAGYYDTDDGYKVAGTKVVGARGAAVADASAVSGTATSGGYGCSSAAEFNALISGINGIKSQLNALLARDRAHGLIAT